MNLQYWSNPTTNKQKCGALTLRTVFLLTLVWTLLPVPPSFICAEAGTQRTHLSSITAPSIASSPSSCVFDERTHLSAHRDGFPCHRQEDEGRWGRQSEKRESLCCHLDLLFPPTPGDIESWSLGGKAGPLSTKVHLQKLQYSLCSVRNHNISNYRSKPQKQANMSFCSHDSTGWTESSGTFIVIFYHNSWITCTNSSDSATSLSLNTERACFSLPTISLHWFSQQPQCLLLSEQQTLTPGLMHMFKIWITDSANKSRCLLTNQNRIFKTNIWTFKNPLFRNKQISIIIVCNYLLVYTLMLVSGTPNPTGTFQKSLNTVRHPQIIQRSHVSVIQKHDHRLWADDLFSSVVTWTRISNSWKTWPLCPPD